MIELKTKVKTPEAEKWLINEGQSRVLNIFEGVCNLVNDAGSVLSLVLRFKDLSPFAMLLETKEGRTIQGLDFRQYADSSSPLDISQHQIVIGGLRVIKDSGTNWNPQPNWPLTVSDRNSGAQDILRQSVIAHAPDASLVSPLLEGKFCAPHHEKTFSLWILMKQGILDNPSNGWQRACQELAGLGPGLTPAGDDFLVGLMLGLRWHLDETRAEELISQIVEDASPKTTTLSRAFLEAAGRMETSYDWHILFDAIHDGKANDIARAAKQLLNTGHTSGADALAGYLAIREVAEEISRRPLWD